MGGHQVQGQNPADSGYDEEGYDESQRAEILEATRDGPNDGTVLTDLEPDLGDPDGEDEDELVMEDGELGEEDETIAAAEADRAEDELQQEFDEDGLAGDDDLGDRDLDAIRP